MSQNQRKFGLPTSHLQQISGIDEKVPVENQKAINIQDLLQFYQINHLKQYSQAVGIIIKQEKIDEKHKSVHLGTAVAVGPRLLLTCNHNVQPTIQNICKLRFISGLQFYKENQQYTEYIGIKTEYKVIPDDLKDQSSKEELAMILLDRDLELDRFCKPSLIHQVEDKSLCTLGYPDNGKESIRIQMEGRLIEVKNGIIFYDVLSWYGSSGSPIFLKDQAGQWQYNGMHSHRGHNNKQGVAFTQENLDILRGFAQTLIQELKLQKFQKPSDHLQQANKGQGYKNSNKKSNLHKNSLEEDEDKQFSDRFSQLSQQFNNYLNVNVHQLHSN